MLEPEPCDGYVFDSSHEGNHDGRSDNSIEYCGECEAVFSHTRRLYRHLFNDHSYSKERIEDYKIQRRVAKIRKKIGKSGESREIFVCDRCGKPYLSKLGLRNHCEKEHNVARRIAQPDSIICPIFECSRRFATYFDLATHADELHREEVVNESIFRVHRARFPNFDKFQDWRMEQETLTSSRFYTRSTETKIRYGKKVWLMKCLHTQRQNRSTPYYGDHCSAFIRLCERFNGDIEAVACFGHLGHPHPTLSDSGAARFPDALVVPHSLTATSTSKSMREIQSSNTNSIDGPPDIDIHSQVLYEDVEDHRIRSRQHQRNVIMDLRENVIEVQELTEHDGVEYIFEDGYDETAETVVVDEVRR